MCLSLKARVKLAHSTFNPLFTSVYLWAKATCHVKITDLINFSSQYCVHDHERSVGNRFGYVLILALSSYLRVSSHTTLSENPFIEADTGMSNSFLLVAFKGCAHVMFRHSLHRLLILGLGLSSLCATGCRPVSADIGRSEDADLVFGGPGTGNGQFVNVRDIAFDKANNLYVLESAGTLRLPNGSTVEGQARIQKFNPIGTFVTSFSLGDALPTSPQGRGPTRIAIDSQGNMGVTMPRQDILRLFDQNGQQLRDVPIPGAQAVTVTQTPAGERFAVMAWKPGGPNGGTGGDAVQMVDPNSGNVQPLPLSEQVKDALDIAATPNGSLWVLGSRQIVGFSANGKEFRTIGSGLKRNVSDGSEPQSSIATDSQGNVYAPVGGNPVLIGRYPLNGQSISLKTGQFKPADSWVVNNSQLPLAIDGTDRLWAATTFYRQGPRAQFSPAIIRTTPNFFQVGASGVKVVDVKALGLSGSITPPANAPYNVLYNLAPVQCRFEVPASKRNVPSVDVKWNVYDWQQNNVAQGQFHLFLRSNHDEHIPITWTPPRYGWYTMRVQSISGGAVLLSTVAHFGVTPRYNDMVNLQAGESAGGWEDPSRQLFSGLPLFRLHVPPQTDPGTLDKWMANLARYKKYESKGLNIIVQLTDNKNNFTPEKLRPALERLRGQVRYIELFNEPNFSYSASGFAAAARPVYQMIKDVDPNFRVLGPTMVALSLPWYEEFFKAGGGNVYDEWSFHDYEGNEEIMPEHWESKFDQFHDMMKRYGVDGRPMWQSERALGAIRVGSFLPLNQAIHVSLHADVLQTLGIPMDHNLHYYLNSGGYSKVPSYLWTSQGPFPGVFVMRTRYEMTNGLGYAGKLDFGEEGDQIFMGLRYQNSNGQDALVSLRNLGDLDKNVSLRVNGSPTLQIVDSWGNTSQVTAQNGTATILVGQMPLYVRLTPGQSVNPIPINLGTNMALKAKLSFSGPSQKPLSLLNNNEIEDEHAGSRTLGKTWVGGPYVPGVKQTIEMTWPSQREISSVLLRGPRADNAFCALLDFDIQALQNGQWKTIVTSRTSIPPSYAAKMGDANSVQWYQDDNVRLCQFDPVRTSALRIVALRSTYGYNADQIGYKLNLSSRRTPPTSVFSLKEIRVFGR